MLSLVRIRFREVLQSLTFLKVVSLAFPNILLNFYENLVAAVEGANQM